MAAGALALGGLLSVGATANADGTSAPVEPAVPPVAASVSTVTLPLLGVPLTAEITTDAGGGLLDVALGSPDDFIATGLRPDKVTFTNETDGTVVRISSKRGGQKIEARGGVLADILGPGGWSGDVFETGDTTAVAFTVTDRGDGTPDIVGVSVTPGLALDAAIGETQYRVDDDGSHSSASVRIEFSYLGQTRTLSIHAKVETDDHDDHDDDEASAKLQIRLSSIKGRQIAEGPAVGPHTWTGQICSGPAQIDYIVNADGSITDVVATPDAEVRAGDDAHQLGDHHDDDHHGHEAVVSFGDHEDVLITVFGNDGDFEVGVSKRVRCDKVEPGVNTEIAPDARESDHDGHECDGGHEHDGDRDGDHDHDCDDDQGHDDEGHDDEGHDDHGSHDTGGHDRGNGGHKDGHRDDG